MSTDVDEGNRPFYVCRLRATSRPVRFVLTASTLEADDGLGAVHLPLKDITQVRLYTRLSHFLSTRYLCDILGRNGEKMRLSNVSWIGIAGVETQDESYSAFLQALHSGLVKEGSQARFERGEPLWRYCAMLAVYALPVVALGWILFQGYQQGVSSGLLATLIFLIAMLWPSVVHARLNRPGCYAPEDLPLMLLPHS